MSLEYDQHELTAILTSTEKEDDEYITVSAPTNLPGGYEMKVDLEDTHWTVQVPDGGVKVGETFRGLVLHKGSPEQEELVFSAVQEPTSSSFRIPTGRWRDDIFNFGNIAGQTQCCLTFWCPIIALGQLMTRLNLNAVGKPASRRLRGFTSPIYVMIYVTIVYWLFFVLPYYGTQIADPTKQPPQWSVVVGYGVLIFVLIAHTRTRNRLRRKYQIGTNFGCLGDCCCAYWVGACSICQMARHTANYRKRHKARCCTETGLDEDVEPLEPLVLTASSAQIV